MAPELRELKEEPGLQRSTAGWRGRLQPWRAVEVEERHVVVERTTTQVAAKERLRRRRGRSAWAATQERRPTAQEPGVCVVRRGDGERGKEEDKGKRRATSSMRAWCGPLVCPCAVCVRGVVWSIHVREGAVWCGVVWCVVCAACVGE